MQSIYSRLSNIYVVKVTVTASESVSISHAGLLKINLFYSAKHAHRTSHMHKALFIIMRSRAGRLVIYVSHCIFYVTF